MLYEFVDCKDGGLAKDPRTQQGIRSHVMQNYRRQKQEVTHPKNEIRRSQKENRDELARVSSGAELPLALSTERWGKDPFDSLPLKMQPQTFDLLDLCKSLHSIER
jgi:hypothetical protein